MTEKSLVERAKGWLENDSKYRPKPVSEISPRIIKDIRELCQAVVEADSFITSTINGCHVEPIIGNNPYYNPKRDGHKWLKKYSEAKNGT